MQQYTQKELDSFEKAKLEMYQGTLAVCFVYGTIAIILIILVLFTEVGREYLYHKMLSATMTFIIGALIIIFYLVFTIYELKPRQRKIKIDVDDDIICPDYWKLKRTDDNIKKELIDNNKKAGVFNDITSVNDAVLNYTCEYNAEVYGDINSYAETKNKIKNKTSFYKSAIKYNDKATSNISYLYIENHNPTNLNDNTIIPYNDDMLGKYAQFSGIYVSGQKTTDGLYTGGTSVFRQAGNFNNSNITANTIFPLDNAQASLDFYHSTKPLICNTVYPQILAKLDKNTPEQNKYRCAYAKACDIAWTDIGCEYNPQSYNMQAVTQVVLSGTTSSGTTSSGTSSSGTTSSGTTSSGTTSSGTTSSGTTSSGTTSSGTTSSGTTSSGTSSSGTTSSGTTSSGTTSSGTTSSGTTSSGTTSSGTTSSGTTSSGTTSSGTTSSGTTSSGTTSSGTTSSGTTSSGPDEVVPASSGTTSSP